MRKGIDVSNYQHPSGVGIDYSQVRGRGIDWCAILLGDGLHFINGFAGWDAPGFRSVGIETCAYFFGRPEQGQAKAQAEHFAQMADEHGPFSKLILDVETGVPMSWAAIADWIVTFRSFHPVDLIYTNMYYRDHLQPLLDLNADEWWLARPGDGANAAGAAAVQYGQGPVPGIIDNVDLNNVWYDRASIPTVKVRPMFDPAPSVVAAVAAPNGRGGWLLTADGGVFTFGDAQFYGAPHGRDYWQGRNPADIRLSTAPGKVYEVVAQSGETYDYPE